MKVIRVVNGYLKENCYLIGEDDSCYVIDPGQFASSTKKGLINNGFNKIKAILLTHGHFDHVSAVDDLVKEYNCPVYLSKFDIEQIDGSLKGNSKLGSLVCELKTITKDVFELNDPNIIVYETPGHTKGSVCYYFKKENILFSGDTLFYECVGRTDLPGGSKTDMICSLKLLKSLDNSILVYPGHEQNTTIGYEKENNDYMNNL